MIRIAVLDRHPAVRAGLEATLDAHPALAHAGGVADPHELGALLYRARPDVVLVEHDPGCFDGLSVCLRLTAGGRPPGVVVCAPGADPALAVPAAMARAGALVDRAAELRELLHAAQVVAAGGRRLPVITPRLQASAAVRLDSRDRAILAMRLAGTTPADIASTLAMSRRDLQRRVRAIVAMLGAPPRAHRTAPALELQVAA